MKLSFPTRFPPAYMLTSAGILFVAAWVEGTDLVMAALAATFLILSGLAFNAAGGLVYPSGAYVFFLATLSVGVGTAAKLLAGEPLDSNLRAPIKSMLVYNAGMLTIYAAATLNRHLRRKRPLLGNMLVNARMDQIAMGCILIGIAGPLVVPESAAATFAQINNFLPFAILLPVYARARETDGESTFNWISFGAWAYSTIVFGLLTFSKQGIYSASVAWAVAALAAGYRIGKVRLLALTVVAVVASSILTPYSQIGRQFRGAADLNDQAIYLLEHPLETRELYALQSERESRRHKSDIHWFEHSQGLLDRLTMFPIDDALIAMTDQGHSRTLYVYATYLMNSVPHLFFPDKPNILWGNEFAHEIGMLSPADHTTSISFSPFSDAYHVGQWQVIFFIAPFMFFVLFYVTDSVAGSTNQTAWALLYVLYFSHTAPEGMMATTVYGSTTFTIAVILGAFVVARITPLLGQLVTLPKPLAPQGVAVKS
ncbi:hypothetical protein Terro_3606 [Terriglobus roseus DSM 18391]|uniref:Uncharacterized protein n=1 Tax=Terriglobus roseus (strain DSM 18391 / NRRL B-41598 / KBS 63) TaxID=926566 RepID=I3ZKQ2_TERRK|nr:hypothetical protein [Terriglobus roseus]AFL89820.1 hypothetical protein Terro_3606 [Terriglobus roseus DSM 18391]